MVSRQSRVLESSVIGIRGSFREQQASTGSPPTTRQRRGIVRRLIAVGVLWLAALAGPATATDYYVATNGNNTWPGTIAQPWQTIKKGADTVSPGDTLYVRGGTYNEKLTFNRGGTPTNKVIVRGYPGETAIIDGNNTLPSDSAPGENWSWSALVTVTVSDIEFWDLTIRNSRGRGLYIGGNGAGVADVVADNVKVSTTMQAGILVDFTDGVTIEDCEVSQAARVNANHNAPSWPVALLIKDSTFTTVRGCNVHENHGENIGDMLSDNTTIEDNISWDSYKINLYLDNSQFTTVRRNIVYATDNTAFWRYGTRPTPGIVVNSEDYSRENYSSNHVITNNFVYNTGSNFAVWTPQPANGTYTNSTIAHNTFVSTRTGVDASYTGVQLMQSAASGNVFRNNITYQAAGTVATGDITGYGISHNNWSTAPPPAFSNVNDVVDDPELQVGTGQHPSESWLTVSGTSPVIDEALAMTAVPNDFFLTARGSSPDIGAYEVPASGGGGGANVLANPGFETTSGWTNFPFAGAQQDAPNARSGTYGLKIRVDSGYTDVYQQVSVTPGATYLANVWAKTYSTDGLSRSQMSVQWYQNGTPIGTATNFTDNGTLTWTKLETASPIAAPAGATHLRITLRRATALAGNYYFDDAEVTKVNLLGNPGFEMTSGWTNFPFAGAQQDAPNARSGTYGLKIRVDSGYTDVYQQVSVTPGVAYQPSVWAKTYSADGVSRSQMSVQWYQNGTPIGTATNFSDNGTLTWTKLETASPITAPAGATHLRMTLRRATPLAGNYYFDDAEIK